MGVLSVYFKCTMCMQWLWRREEGVRFPKLEFQVVVNCPIGAGNNNGVLWENRKCRTISLVCFYGVKSVSVFLEDPRFSALN